MNHAMIAIGCNLIFCTEAPSSGLSPFHEALSIRKTLSKAKCDDDHRQHHHYHDENDDNNTNSTSW